MTEEVKLLVGIPASGKSTWANMEAQRQEEEHKTTCIISRDYVRRSLLQPGDLYFDREKEVFDEFVRQANEAIELGINIVIIDATHISPPSRRKILSRLVVDPRTDLSFEVFPISVKTAIKRNAERFGFERVPDDAIRNMAKGFSHPSFFELPDSKYGFRNVSINTHRKKEKK